MMAEVSRKARLDGEWSTLKWPTHGKLRVSSVRSAMSIAKRFQQIILKLRQERHRY